jgi:hypothetical protein
VLSDVTGAEAADAPEVVRELHRELVALAEPILALTPESLRLVDA